MNFHNKHSLGDISLLSHHQQCSLSMWLCIVGFHVFLNEGITMCLNINKCYTNVRQHNLFILE